MQYLVPPNELFNQFCAGSAVYRSACSSNCMKVNFDVRSTAKKDIVFLFVVNLADFDVKLANLIGL